MKQKPPAVWEAFSVGRNARHDGFPWRKAIMRHACMRALQAECDAVIDRKRTILRRERRPRRSAKRYQNQPYNPSVTASPCHRLAFRLGRRFCLRQRCPPDTRALAGEAWCACPVEPKVPTGHPRSPLPGRSALLPSAKVSTGHPRPCRGGKNPSGLPCGNPPPLAGEASGVLPIKKQAGRPVSDPLVLLYGIITAF